MKIYLAGPCDHDNRAIMIKIAAILREKNIEIYCPWELKIENAWDYSQEDWAMRVFAADTEAIEKSNVMLVISMGRNSTAGTNWEQGYAFGLHKPIAVLQTTDAPTSIMTFWGCDYFKNTDINNLEKDLDWIVDHLEKDDLYMYENGIKCETILT